jgi:mRNA-degrading endonuclease RelE of RelBE toxin-antitoxin system
MSFNIIATEPFARKLKKLAKKYRSLKEDLLPLLNELETNPTLGIPLGKDLL